MNLVTWEPIASEADIQKLLKTFGGFHDGCLREAHVWTEHWVNPDLSMNCLGSLDNRVRLLIQRQFHSPSAIELLFEQVLGFHLQPSPENFDSIIDEASLLLTNNTFYWAAANPWSTTSPARDQVTWIASKKISWRNASDWMGKNLHYGPHDSTYNATTL